MKRSVLVMLCVLATAVTPGCDLFGTNREFVPLEFPFATPSSVVRLAAFGIPNWSGADPHNGIDLILAEGGAATRIVSPTAGEVVSVEATENSFSHPPGQLILTVAIKVNDEWTVNLILEPGTADPATRTAQRAAVLVDRGDEVGAGDPIADLLVGNLGYPHLHYMVMKGNAAVCAYANSSEAAKRVFETIAAKPGSSVPGGRICVE
jgi:murein DD-endopeptidase MepM/ murein hydrolase activator NlpD